MSFTQITVPVGEPIKKRKHLRKLPPGSVVVNDYGYAILILPDGLTASASGRVHRIENTEQSSPPYRVIHLGK